MRPLAALILGGFAIIPALAQPQQSPSCPATPAYSQCEMAFELSDADAAAHANPYVSVQLHAEFRGPRHKTFLMPAFWAGGRNLIIRFAPNEPGDWEFRLTSNIERFNDKTGTFQATASEAPGYVRNANLHHWATLAGENITARKPHLWMGDTNLRFAFQSDDEFRKQVDARAAQKFNHMRVLLIGEARDGKAAYRAPDQPVPEYFQRIDDRIRYMNSKGIIADLVLAGARNHLTQLFPNWDQRQNYIRYVIARYSSMNVTWQGVEDFETYDNAKPLVREINNLLKQHDPYQHVRTSDARDTSAPLGGDGWLNYVAYKSSDDQLGAIEHQLYPLPFVNLRFGEEGAVDANEFRRRLWNSTMNGQYPTYARSPQVADLNSPGAQAMANWFKFFDDTRHWELEPYFDVDNARAVALEGIEYIVYVEKPGPVEVGVEKHGYDISWFNPANGETVPMKKWKGERWTGEPPDRTHDWVLHIEREGRKESMLNSYRFDSREIPLQLQEPEQTVQKTPFEIVEPSGTQLPVSKAVPYSIKMKRETRATRTMMYLWTAEVPSDGQGFRVVGTGREGKLTVPKDLAKTYPNTLSLRVAAMNANGKVYLMDKVFRLVE